MADDDLDTVSTYLIDKLTTMNVISDQYLCPKFWLTTLHEVTRLLFEHRVVVRDGDELIITEALCVCDVRKVRISRLAEFTYHQRLVKLIRAYIVSNPFGKPDRKLTLFSFKKASGLLLLSM